MRPITLKDIEKPKPPPKVIPLKRQVSERQIAIRTIRWWEKESIKYAFSDAHVRSHLEKLMGSNLVSLTDRAYMQKLAERIIKDFVNDQEARSNARVAAEEERVKNLVLSGKIPFAEAPPEMAYHPVMLIEEFCNKLIAERRAKIKIPKVHIPKFLYWDDTPDPPSGLGIEKGHWFRSSQPPLCVSAGRFLATTDEEEIENHYMLPEEDYDALIYVDERMDELDDCETVEEMYDYVEELIGELSTLPK
ncbi:uncharacterized protein [Onthophagus taurus]|uniref:uncharacterized protein n=1 Tax=Onthophagus taurus TaxID=166361 RepID=UPI0039BECA72